jgi:hypothetical protein
LSVVGRVRQAAAGFCRNCTLRLKQIGIGVDGRADGQAPELPVEEQPSSGGEVGIRVVSCEDRYPDDARISTYVSLRAYVPRRPHVGGSDID